jgi:DNA-directed RNA polymerase specialized sigma24 family protein
MELQGGNKGSTGDELGELEAGELAGLLGRLGVPREAVAGVAREAFLKGPVFTEEFGRDRASLSCLLSIGFQAAADYWRRSHSASHLAGWGEEGRSDESAEATAIELLKLGFERLPPIRREVVEMRDLLGFSLPGISEALGIPLAKANSHLQLGRRELAAVIRSVLAAAALPED